MREEKHAKSVCMCVHVCVRVCVCVCVCVLIALLVNCGCVGNDMLWGFWNQNLPHLFTAIAIFTGQISSVKGSTRLLFKLT